MAEQHDAAAASRRQCGRAPRTPKFRTRHWGLWIAGAALLAAPAALVVDSLWQSESWIPPAPAGAETEDSTAQRATNKRYAIKGPVDNREGGTGTRARALREAQEFGSIGLLNSGAGGIGTGQGFGSGHGRLGGSAHAVRGLGAGGGGTYGVNGARDSGKRFKAEAGWNRDRFDHFVDNPFVRVGQDPRSTFSIDVDTAAYSLVRSHLERGDKPPRGSVRTEELINYFRYDYPDPTGGAPFAVAAEVAAAPWSTDHRLIRIGIQGKKISVADRPAANLVFLLDVSGSMQPQNKLPLMKRGLRLLVEQLRPDDRVSIVVYAGASGLVLPPTPGDQRQVILSALDRLDAGGSTNGGAGVRLAYAQAKRSFKKGGINRVVLATDGDFNVGVTSESELVRLIQKQAKGGVFLSVLGFGDGNYNDATLEKLADRGNGNYAYVDTLSEARKVLVEQASGTLLTIAKDVKLQLEFNPATVEAFRLIGYENRLLAHRDFNDDRKDAGELGAGHTVTALYEVIPAGGQVPEATTDGLKYQAPRQLTGAAGSGELVTVKLRYKPPAGTQSRLLQVAVRDSGTHFASASPDFRFAASVAGFGMVLRESRYKGSWAMADVVRTATASAGVDPRRQGFVTLVLRAGEVVGS